MKRIVCAVWDSAVQSYGQPFFTRARGEATRSFTDEVNKKDGNALNAHPEDYELRYLGLYDDESGTFEQEEITTLLRGKDVVQS